MGTEVRGNLETGFHDGLKVEGTEGQEQSPCSWLEIAGNGQVWGRRETAALDVLSRKRTQNQRRICGCLGGLNRPRGGVGGSGHLWGCLEKPRHLVS